MKAKRLLGASVLVLMLNQCAPECAPSPPASVSWSVNWDRVAWCESGGNWHYPPVVGGLGHTYSGGLMIWQKAWEYYGGRQFASWAYLATKSAQIVVAERILADNGRGAWDCL